MNNAEAKVKELEAKLAEAPSAHDFLALKKEIAVLKSLDDISVDDDTLHSPQGVQKILKEKNRKLETENMQLKARSSEQKNRLEELENEAKSLRADIDAKQNLIESLEEDISQGVASTTSLDTGAMTNNGNVDEGDDEDFSMIDIVCSQRDRFKAHNLQLEDANLKMQMAVSEMVEEIQKLKSDNVELYAKIQYLQSYKQYNKGDVENRNSNAHELKYKKLYENSVNPFNDFNKKVKYERYKHLNAAEKVTLTTWRWCMASKYLRNFIFFYVVALHILVFSTLYHFASVVH
eukprot:TRINITY_DN6971_c0_g3_i1.p1 TRINITY_DN6971_c0_g3~~TRINITY_DN6971_c0_g3_i1.p1  ORF type:complete len:323 (-),score=70.04 TRINITY_DN6971_c0_g3_i1:156-1028(-)